MERNPLDYQPAHASGARSSIVHAERTANGVVTVRVSYSPEQLRGMVMGLLAVAVLPIIVFSALLITFPAREVFPFLFLLFPIGALFVFLGWRVVRFRPSYTFQADASGITIQSYRGRREWCERLPRDQITNVRLGFGVGKQGGAWLIISLSPPYRFNRRLLSGLGGDHLARVADALRLGIGLPRASWPSGLPITPAPERRP